MLTFADVGNDANIFNNSLLGKGLAENPFNIPESNNINGGFKFPFVVLGDYIFALKKYLMKPFSGRNISDKELVFNWAKQRNTYNIALIRYTCRKIENFRPTN